MEQAGDMLRRMAVAKDAGVAIPKQTARRLDAIELVRRGRDEHSQELAYNSRPFVLCGLPIRRPPPGSFKHTRRNGRFTLEIVGHPDFGLPYGQDRLIPLWLATLAVRQKSRMVFFDSGAQIMRTFGLPLDGVHYRRLVAGFKRVFSGTNLFRRHCGEPAARLGLPSVPLLRSVEDLVLAGLQRGSQPNRGSDLGDPERAVLAGDPGASDSGRFGRGQKPRAQPGMP